MRASPLKAFRRFAAPGARARRIPTLLVCLAAAFGTLAAPGALAQEKVTLRVASFMAVQAFLATAIVIPYLDRVVADSKGTLDYKFFPGGTMGRSPAEQLKLVQDGTADMAIVIPAYTPGAYENYEVTQLPGVTGTARAASLGTWRAFEAGLIPEPDKVKVLGIVTTASNILHMKKPAPDIASLSGRRIRAAGALQVSVMEKLGAAAVGNIRGPEIAEALSRNVLDGTLMDWIGIKEFRVDRTSPYHVEADFGRIATIVPINAQRFATLPEAAKASLLKHGGVEYANIGGKAFDDAVIEFRTNYQKEGGHKTSVFPAADQARIKATFDAVVGEWVKAAPGRDKVLDAFRKGAAEAR